MCRSTSMPPDLTVGSGGCYQPFLSVGHYFSEQKKTKQVNLLSELGKWFISYYFVETINNYFAVLICKVAWRKQTLPWLLDMFTCGQIIYLWWIYYERYMFGQQSWKTKKKAHAWEQAFSRYWLTKIMAHRVDNSLLSLPVGTVGPY